jgi:predicted metallopeptidase
MVIRYSRAPELEADVKEIVIRLGLTHVDPGRVICVRSKGTEAKRTLARIHGLPRLWQFTLGTKPCYVIEVVSESFDLLSREEREKTIIHELLHIPASFGGGFRHHKGWVDRQRVEKVYKMLQERRRLGKPLGLGLS